MDDESLQTFFVEIESILNNRPLTPVSDDSIDFSALNTDVFAPWVYRSDVSIGRFHGI